MAAKRSLMLTCFWKLPCYDKVAARSKVVNPIYGPSPGAYNVPLEERF